MTRVEFTVPGQPQGKGRARVGKVGRFARMYTPAKTVAYESLVSMAAHQAMQGRPLILGPVDVHLDIYLAVPASWSQKKQNAALNGLVLPTTKPDADNCCKGIFDGMNGVVWKDDVQAVNVTLRKRYSATPGVRVVAYELENA